MKRFVYCASILGSLFVDTVGIAAPKPLINYVQPIPIMGQLSQTVWGASVVGARDPSNGIEDPNKAGLPKPITRQLN